MFGDYNNLRKRDTMYDKITGATEFPCKSSKFMGFYYF